MRTATLAISSLLLTFAIAIDSTAQTTPNPKPDAIQDIDRVVGHYRFKSGAVMSIEKSGESVSATSTGQPAQLLTVSPDGKFSYSSISAYLTFDKSATPSKTLTFHMDDHTLVATRIDATEAKKVADAWALKIKNQTHDPTCETTLKRLIEELRGGKPNFDKMMPVLAQATRMQLPMLQQRFVELGAVKETKFVNVGPNGAEQFDVAFEKGATQWRILCLSNGYVGAAGFR